jgi:hypothetical protein
MSYEEKWQSVYLSEAIKDAKFLCESIAPLGGPVVPDV